MHWLNHLCYLSHISLLLHFDDIYAYCSANRNNKTNLFEIKLYKHVDTRLGSDCTHTNMVRPSDVGNKTMKMSK